MEITKLVLTKLTIEEMLVRPEKEYNQRVWEDKIRRFTEYDSQFYVVEASKESGYDYARFFTTHKADGLLFFSEWSGYSSCLSNAGFCKVFISEKGEVYKSLFNFNGKLGYAENSTSNRKALRQLTPLNIFLSTCV